MYDIKLKIFVQVLILKTEFPGVKKLRRVVFNTVMSHPRETLSVKICIMTYSNDMTNLLVIEFIPTFSTLYFKLKSTSL